MAVRPTALRRWTSTRAPCARSWRRARTHFYAFSARDYHRPNFHVTADGSEALWYSQRSGAGQLYLYDAETGELKNQVTEGGVVFDIIRVDDAARQVYFTAGGREDGRNPYFAHLYRGSFDGGEAELLTPEDAAHEFFRYALGVRVGFGSLSKFSPSGDYFVDVFSTLEQPPAMVIRDRDGNLVAEVLRADASRLLATGWQPPERFVVKAADGEDRPVRGAVQAARLRPGPEVRGGRPDLPGTADRLRTAHFPRQLRRHHDARRTRRRPRRVFVVVTVDGRGTTRRDRDFRYAFSGTEDLFGAADHKAAIENLAADRPYMDTSRVGITGASFGGYGSLRAALLFPGFFDVVVSHVGPHEYLHSVTSGISVERLFGVPGSDRDVHELTSNIAIIDRLEARPDAGVRGDRRERAVPGGDGDLRCVDESGQGLHLVRRARREPCGAAAAHPYIVKRQRRFFEEHLGGPTP